MTDDEIEALAKKHIAPHAGRLAGIRTDWPPYQQTEQFRRVKALILDVLSKLRAPVAEDMGKLPEYARSAQGQRVYSLAYARGRKKGNEEARAALASAPVAEPETMEEIHRRERDRAPWVLPKDPTLPESAPVAEEITGASQLSADEADDVLSDPNVLAALADGLESIKGNENAALAAILARREAARLAAQKTKP